LAWAGTWFSTLWVSVRTTPRPVGTLGTWRLVGATGGRAIGDGTGAMAARGAGTAGGLAACGGTGGAGGAFIDGTCSGFATGWTNFFMGNLVGLDRW
jgi:hypothetical protein